MHDAASLALLFRKYRDHRVALQAAGLLALSALAGGCGGSSDSMLLVNVSSIPATATTMTVQAKLDAKTSATQLTISPLSPPMASFGVALPAAQTGQLALDLTAMDSTGCKVATAETDAISLPNQRVDSPVMVAMTPADTSKCTTPPPTCSTGLLCNYTPLPQTKDISNLWATSANDIWGVGQSGSLVHYDGQSWTKVSLGITRNLYAVWASSASDVWVVGASGYITHYNGSAWSPVSNGAVYDLNGIYGISANNVWAVGSNDAISGGRPEFWHWDGSSWGSIDPGYNGSLTGVWASATNDIHACGANGFLIHYTGTWSKISGPSANLQAIWGMNATNVFAVGAGGTVLYYNGSWKGVSSTGTSSTLNALFGDSTNVFAVGNGGTIIHATLPISSFQAYSTGISTALYAIQPTGTGIGWIAGANGYLANYNITR